MHLRFARFRPLYQADSGGAGTGAGQAPAPGNPTPGTAAQGTGQGTGTGTGTPGAGTVAFAETLPADIRGEAVFANIKDLDSLARGYRHAQTLIGADPSQVLRLPGADDVAAWDSVYARLGRPDKADAYKLADPQLPAGMQADPTLRTGYAEAAHKAGLSERQAAALYEWYNGQAAQRYTAAGAETQRAAQASEQSLRQAWGTAFDDNLAMARNAINHYGGANLRAELDGLNLANSPQLAQVFAKIGAGLREDGLIGTGGSGSGGASPAEALQQINVLRGDTAFLKSYTDRADAGHAAAVAKMALLYQQAYPTAAA